MVISVVDKKRAEARVALDEARRDFAKALKAEQEEGIARCMGRIDDYARILNLDLPENFCDMVRQEVVHLAKNSQRIGIELLTQPMYLGPL